MKGYKAIEAKVCIVGETAVGKTCIIHRTIDGNFIGTTQPTISGVHDYHYDKDGNKIDFKIWDTAGQDTYRSLVPFYWQKAHVIIVVFDVTNKESYDALQEWHRFIPEPIKNTALLVLVGNKKDLSDSRVVDTVKAEDTASQLDYARYFEVSAKSGEGISDLWDFIATSPEIGDISPDDEPAPLPPEGTDYNNGEDTNTDTNNDNTQNQGIISTVLGYVSSAVNYVKSFF